MHDTFDQEIPRKGTNSVKWEFGHEGDRLVNWEQTDKALGAERILPMWVADMDFRCPQPVVDALVERARHGIFGYAMQTEFLCGRARQLDGATPGVDRGS